MIHYRALAALVSTAGVTAAVAQTAPTPQLPDYSKTPSELAAIAPTGGAGGSGSPKVQVVNILGDPSKPGPYGQLLKVAPHATIAAHHHAGDRIGTVLEGTWMFGYGKSFDQAVLRTLPVGSVYTEPSGEAHFAKTGDQEVTVLITGLGPTDTVYENPADDPTKKR
jgi:quercetin dioxygenase-like cupin family protein